MKTVGWLVALVVVAAAASFGGYEYALRHAGAGASKEAEGENAEGHGGAEEEHPVVPVTTAALRSAEISETVTAYGTVVAEAGDVRVVSVPFESRVLRVLVTPGQAVAPGTPVVRLEASPDALVALQEATDAVDATARDLKQVEERIAEHLATNVELSQAQQAARVAKLKLGSLKGRGVGQQHELKADFAGIVNKVNVQEGQIVAAGGALLELAAGNRIEIRLNVEPSDAAEIKPGQPVRVRPVGGAGEEAIDGKVRIVAGRVDPATRLVEVRVSLPSEAHLMLDGFVTGELVRRSAKALVAPRSAALPNEDGTYTVFTVRDRHAVAHVVRVGLRDRQDVQVVGEGLKAGDAVIVGGNYLVKDGTEVETGEGAKGPDEPATAPAARGGRP